MSIKINFGTSPKEIHYFGDIVPEIWDIIYTYKNEFEERDMKTHKDNYSKVHAEIEDAANKYWLQWNLAIGEELPTEEDEEEYGFDDCYYELEKIGYEWCDHGRTEEYPADFDRERRIVWHSKIDIILNRVNEEDEVERSQDHVQLNSFRTAMRPWNDSKPEGGVDYMIRDCDGEGQHLFEVNYLGPYNYQYVYIETYEGEDLLTE